MMCKQPNIVEDVDRHDRHTYPSSHRQRHRAKQWMERSVANRLSNSLEAAEAINLSTSSSVFRQRQNHTTTECNLKPSTTTTTTTTRTLYHSDSSSLSSSSWESHSVLSDNSGIAVLHCDEITTGELVGQGAFSEVWEIHEIRLRTDDTTSNTNSTTSSIPLSPSSSPQEEEEGPRKRLRDACNNHKMTKRCPTTSRYVMKHLRDDLLLTRTPNHINSQTKGNQQHQRHQQYHHNTLRRYVQAATDLVLEAKFLSSLHHPNIVKMHGCSSVDKGKGANFFLILERLEETLTQRLRRWKQTKQSKNLPQLKSVLHLQYERKLSYAYQIANALAYLHDRGIIFRDLKPSNLGFTYTCDYRGGGDTLKLFDFGLCRELPTGYGTTTTSTTEDPSLVSSSLSQEQHVEEEQVFFYMSGAGTRRYMAPEIIMGQPYNLKADVYSWAMVFYEILSLTRPYDMYNRKVHQLLVAEGGQRPPMRGPYWSEDLKHLLNGAWEHDPQERLSIHQVQAKLEPLMDLAERETLSPSQRSARVILEMADLLMVAPPPSSSWSSSLSS